jgi:hypothetical protein
MHAPHAHLSHPRLAHAPLAQGTGDGRRMPGYLAANHCRGEVP